MNYLSNAIYKSLFFFVYLLSLLPMSVLYKGSSVLYFCLYRLGNYRKHVVIQNVSRSFPRKKYDEINTIVQEFYSNFADFFVEVLKNVSISPKQISDKLEIEGFEFIEEQIKQGKNVLACLGHCGNWEILNCLPLKLSVNVYSAYKPIRASFIDKFMLSIRSRFGAHLIPAKSIARHILSNKGLSSLYILIGDQCPKESNDKFSLSFLNQPTLVYPGTEKLAKATNSVVVYIKLTRVEKGVFKAKCIPICKEATETGVMEITSKYIGYLEQSINEQPASWLWTHKRWKRQCV